MSIENRSMGGKLGFEEKLWLSADKMRSNMDAAEYKHVVLDLIFLKYISDAFGEVYEELQKDTSSEPENVGEYVLRKVFWVPKESRWNYLSNHAKSPEIGKVIDNAMDLIENENPSLKGVLQKNFARSGLNKQRLGELIDLIGTIGLGDAENRSKDILGNIYEYFLGKFADAEGKKGGQFYTTRSIVQVLVEMLEPFEGKIFDPCCGSGGMFVQSEKFINSQGRKIDNASIYGQESNQTTWRLCKMNLALRGINSEKILWNSQGSFLNDEHKDLKADFIIANPPFNDSDWGGEFLETTNQWDYGIPPKGNANFAWVQHFIQHLNSTGTAGFVLANSSMSSNTTNEGEIRKNIIKEDLVDCMVALPPQLFSNTTIPACLWFIARNKQNNGFKNRQKKILFIDARKFGTMIDRKQRIFSSEEVHEIADTYHSWRQDIKTKKYQDVPGFCKSVSIDIVEKNGWVLTPGMYVGIEEENKKEDDNFEEKMKGLLTTLSTQMKQSDLLNKANKKNLGDFGYEI